MSQYIPVMSGPWSEDATWGPVQGHPPGETDTVLINLGHTITIDTNIKVKQITLADGGLLVADDTTPTIEVTDGFVLVRRLRPMPFRLDGATIKAPACLGAKRSEVADGFPVTYMITATDGSGIIIDGKIWKGYHGIGGELGHMILELDGQPCSCGNRGCLEQYCSATALIRMAREQVAVHPDSLMLKLAEGDARKINAKIVFDAKREGDPAAEKIFRRYVKYMGQMIANLVNFIDPEIIVLGGGVSKAGSLLLDAVRKEFVNYVLYDERPQPRIEIASLSSEAGIIGAAMLS